MSVEAMTWAFKQPLPPGPKSVLVALANRANEDGFCWPGVDDLERRTGWSARSIRRYLQDLKNLGLIDLTDRHSPKTGVQLSNLYRLRMCVSVAMPPRGEADMQTAYPDTDVPPMVTHRQGEGDTPSPESSSEQSSEHTRYSGVGLPLGGTTIRTRAGALLSHLNQAAGKHFPARTPKGDPTTNLLDIESRLREGYSDEQCQLVIDWKVAEWRGKTNREGVFLDKWLRPSTLFGRKNFSTYIGEVQAGRPNPGGPLPRCVWSVPEGHRMRSCGDAPDLKQIGPIRPFCSRHLPLRQELDKKRSGA